MFLGLSNRCADRRKSVDVLSAEITFYLVKTLLGQRINGADVLRAPVRAVHKSSDNQELSTTSMYYVGASAHTH